MGYWNSTPVYALIHKRRYICTCCHKTFYEEIPGISHYQQNQKFLEPIKRFKVSE